MKQSVPHGAPADARTKIMKRHHRNPQRTKMSPDAYAGFLRLLLTPADQVPASSPELEAYLSYRSRMDPLPDNVQHILGHPVVEAA